MANIYTVVLDPSAVAINRTQLDLNNQNAGFKIGGIGGGNGIDWGQAAINEYLAEQGQWGSSVVDFTVPNRTITISLLLGADQTGLEEVARSELQQKVARFQAEGGWLLRQRYNGPAMYADIVDASLTIPDNWGETGGVEPAVTLVLEALPDFYGDEIPLDSLLATGDFHAVLLQGGQPAVIQGDYPGRARIALVEGAGHQQNGVLWGFRSRHYDSAATAALSYEAELMTPLNGAAITAVSGASGGNLIELASLPVGGWVPFLRTDLLSGGPLTHQGTYRVWGRAYSPNSNPQIRLVWGAADSAHQVMNDPAVVYAQIPAPPLAGGPNPFSPIAPGAVAGDICMIDLGTIRIDPPVLGNPRWTGVFQAMGNSGGGVGMDKVYLVPIDESAGRVAASQQSQNSQIVVVANATAVAETATGAGPTAWTNPSFALGSQDGQVASIGPGSLSQFLELSGFGFAVPSGATITGIGVVFLRDALGTGVLDGHVQLMKAGVPVGTDVASPTPWASGFSWAGYGGAGALFGTTWSPADINDPGFGAAIAIGVPAGNAGGIDTVGIYVAFTLGSGFTTIDDAVMYPHLSAQLRSDGMIREDSSASVYGQIAQVIGDLPRIPPSGLEQRPAELMVKISRGDFDTLPDIALDNFGAQVFYRPCWLSRP